MTKIEKLTDASNLWSQYKDQLRFYILKRMKNEDLANEITHLVLMKLYNSCCSGKEIRNVRSWMFQIAQNTLIDHLRKENRYRDEVSYILEDDEQNTYKEAEELVAPLIKLLPEKYSVPLQLSDVEGTKQIEIAHKLNLSLTATKSRIQRARVMLKQKMMDCCILEINDKGNLISIEVNPACKPLKDTSKKN